MKNKIKRIVLGWFVLALIFQGFKIKIFTEETRIRVGEKQQEVVTVLPEFAPLANLRGTQIFLNGNFGWNGGNSPYADGYYHEGSDFGCEEASDPIYAIHDGEVVYQGKAETGFGNLVIVESGGIQSRYGHLDSFAVESGDKIRKGQKVGICGNTGFSSGAHLHLECRENGVLVRCYDLVMGDTQKYHDSAQNACESLGYFGCRETMDALEGKSVDFFQLLAFSGNSEGIKALEELENRNLYSISPKANDLDLSTEDWRRKRVALMHQFYKGLNPQTENTGAKHTKVYLPNHSAKQNEYMQYAFEISNFDKEFLYLLKGECGVIDPKCRGDYVNGVPQGHGFCQFDIKFHTIMWDERFESDWKWQMQSCYDYYADRVLGKRGSATAFYALTRYWTEPSYAKRIEAFFQFSE